ncbi:MAG: hypothetical protein JW891_17665 [Candidatus Lokiarchaeota archaeon]|nr:hypothetical protein [Candidatus Lokiarchaeota archaeon]
MSDEQEESTEEEVKEEKKWMEESGIPNMFRFFSMKKEPKDKREFRGFN